MEYTFAQVERALAKRYNVADGRQPAFRARLQHLQKLKFPPGINTGRGRAARYNAAHLYLLGVALELLQLGLSPERAIGAISDDVHAVAMAGAMAARGGIPTQGVIESPIFLYCDPAVLRHLMQPDEERDWASATFFYAGLGQAMEQFENWFRDGVPRMAFFSVSALLFDLASHIRNDTEPLESFYAEIEAWADPLIHNVDYRTDRPDQPFWNTVYIGDGA